MHQIEFGHSNHEWELGQQQQALTNLRSLAARVATEGRLSLQIATESYQHLGHNRLLDTYYGSGNVATKTRIATEGITSAIVSGIKKVISTIWKMISNAVTWFFGVFGLGSGSKGKVNGTALDAPAVKESVNKIDAAAHSSRSAFKAPASHSAGTLIHATQPAQHTHSAPAPVLETFDQMLDRTGYDVQFFDAMTSLQFSAMFDHQYQTTTHKAFALITNGTLEAATKALAEYLETRTSMYERAINRFEDGVHQKEDAKALIDAIYAELGGGVMERSDKRNIPAIAQIAELDRAYTDKPKSPSDWHLLRKPKEMLETVLKSKAVYDEVAVVPHIHNLSGPLKQIETTGKRFNRDVDRVFEEIYTELEKPENAGYSRAMTRLTEGFEADMQYFSHAMMRAMGLASSFDKLRKALAEGQSHVLVYLKHLEHAVAKPAHVG